MKLTVARIACIFSLMSLTASSGFGATYTWTGSNSTPPRNWFTVENGGTYSTVNFGTSSSIVAGDSFVFPTGASTRSPNLNISYQAQGITVDSAGPYTFTSSSSAVLSIGAGGITKTGNGALTFNGPIAINSNQTWSAGGVSPMSGDLTVANNALSGTSNITIYTQATNGVTILNAPSYSGTASVLAGSLFVNGDSFGGSITSGTGITGVFFGPSSSLVDQTVAGSLTIGGQVTIQRVLTNVAVGGPITFLNGSTINMSFANSGTAADNHSFSTPGNLEWGGANLILNLTAPSGTVANDTAWDFFNFTTQSGSLSGITILPPSGSPYEGLTFATATSSASIYDQRYGAGVWLSDWTVDGQRFVFNQANGVLTIVPEPSTFVFAGIGVAMLGWQTWAGRRRKARMKLVDEHTRRLSQKRGIA